MVLPEDRAIRVFKALPIWERYMHQHPVLAHFQQFPHDAPRKVTASDLEVLFRGALGYW